MKQWWTIYQKELTQAWRNKQLVWVPLVMMLVAVMDLLTYYYLPEIIELSGGLPEGAVFEAPTLLPNEAIIMGLEQLSFLGVLIIIAISMGTIAGERQHGVAEIILTKPIHHGIYITAKWASFVTISLLSLFLALGLNWYYTNALLAPVSISLYMYTVLFYSLWFIFVIAIVLFFSAFFNKSGYVFASTAIVLVLMHVVNLSFSHKLTYFPNQLTYYMNDMLVTENISNELLYISGIITLIIVILLISASAIFKRKKL